MRVDGSEQPLAQIMLLQQVPEVQDRRLIRQRIRQSQSHKPTHGLRLVEQILHPRITQVIEQLHAMNPQHHAQRVRLPTAADLRIERLDPTFQSFPGDQLLHSLQKELPPCATLLPIVFQPAPTWTLAAATGGAAVPSHARTTLSFGGLVGYQF